MAGRTPALTGGWAFPNSSITYSGNSTTSQCSVLVAGTIWSDRQHRRQRVQLRRTAGFARPGAAATDGTLGGVAMPAHVSLALCGAAAATVSAHRWSSSH